ncbi:MAG: sugar transferase, partial [Acidimicrobiales bacterium]
MSQTRTMGHHLVDKSGPQLSSRVEVDAFSGSYGTGIRSALAHGYARQLELHVPTAARHPRVGTGIADRSLTLIQASRWSVATVMADIVFAGGPALAFLGSVTKAAAAVFIWLVIAAITGVYRFRSPVASQGYMWYVRLLLLPVAVVTFVTWGSAGLEPHWTDSFQMTLAMAGGLVALRIVAWVFVGISRRKGKGLERTLVLADAVESARLATKLRTFPDSGLEFCRAQNVSARRRKTDVLDAGAGAGIPDRHRELDLAEIDHVLIGLSSVSALADGHVLEAAARGRASVSVVAPGTSIHRWTSARRIGDVPVDTLNAAGPMTGRLWSKRLIDITAASIGLILVSPVLALAALAIRIQDRGPIFYRQERVGRHNNVFRMWKLRTMVVDAHDSRSSLDQQNSASGLLFKMQADPRVTSVGALLRRFAIDEIPQLINVVTGDMSLVGPRPLAVEPQEFDDRAVGRHNL